MSNPLVDRILSNPLTFVAAKAPEKDAEKEKNPAYIVLGSKKSVPSHEAPVLMPKRTVRVQPRSMADAIAAYTGRKYLTKKEKKEKKEKEKAEKAEKAVESSDESHYELASEFQTDSSFQGFRSSDEPEKDELEQGDVPSTESSDAEAEATSEVGSAKLDSVEPDDELDGSYNGESAEDEDEDEDEESEGEKETEAYGVAHESGDSDADVSDADPEDMAQLKSDLLADARRSPPASSDLPSKELETAKKLISVPKHPEGHYNITETALDRGLNGSSRIVKNWTKKFQGKHPVGLLNFGVTCYMNSAIQLMVHIPAVQHYLLEVLEGKHELPNKSVTHSVAELSSRMWGFSSGHGKGPRKFVNPKKVIQRLFDINCMMSEWQQEDSHEYFMSLMSRFQEDSTPKGHKLNESIIYDIFGGLLQQEVTCRECNTVSTTKQEFYDLSLGLNKKRRSLETEEVPCGRYSIDKSINEYFSMETIKKDKVDASSGYHCEKCKKRTVATKKSMIERSPETLMVHLKRFKFNGLSSSKVKQAIVYPGFLDLGPYTMTQESTKYQLISVIVHEGRSILSGHYICHCLQPDGLWLTYDDEYINKTDERKAMSDPSAYCLIYTKLTPKEEESSDGKKRKSHRGAPAAKRAKH